MKPSRRRSAVAAASAAIAAAAAARSAKPAGELTAAHRPARSPRRSRANPTHGGHGVILQFLRVLRVGLISVVSSMSLAGFHPLVSDWFTQTLGSPTPAQERGWAAIRDRRHTLIAAPTGSGKTLAAFLTALDELTREAIDAPLADEVRVVYVSPLKALSADIHKNLAEPRRGIHRLAEEAGFIPPRITAAVRTGDTTQGERAAMIKTPPHILVTTPESLYLMLTAERSRQMLRTVRTVIVDEIHAVIGTRRGAHLALSLERLQQIAGQPLLRIGLSATQKPIEDVARFLVGNVVPAEAGPHGSAGPLGSRSPDVAIV